MKSRQNGGYVRKLTQRTERLRCFLAEAFSAIEVRTGVRTLDASVAESAALYCGTGACIPGGRPRGDLFAETRSSDRLVRSVAIA